ncbi:G-protein coupled receptor 1 [Sesamum angolense]|uniref:G-protein coupled receptor 1 n=1 Tax=Sesamum angolense TaxID=2727404 RepID=A0AAE1WX14_9LAMI|nr:G-protein coupled receptor 1 [Sesamum angolense]
MATLQAVLGNLTATERGILTTINTGASSLSLVGSGFIVLCYLLFKVLRKFSFKLVFFLALSDMFCSFFGIIGDPSKGYFCYAQGYTTHFFCVASFLWTTTIAFTLHRTVVRHKTDVEDLEPMFHLYVWGTSVVMTVIRSIGNDHSHMSRIGPWCLSRTGRTGKVVHFITFYAPLWGAILFNAITYFQVIRMLKNATRMAAGMSDRAYQSDVRPDMKALNRWGYYPLILIGSWFFGTINRIHDFIEPGHKIFWLSVLDVGMAALMGLFNSIAYGLNSSVRRAIYERLDLEERRNREAKIQAQAEGLSTTTPEQIPDTNHSTTTTNMLMLKDITASIKSEGSEDLGRGRRTLDELYGGWVAKDPNANIISNVFRSSSSGPLCS